MDFNSCLMADKVAVKCDGSDEAVRLWCRWGSWVGDGKWRDGLCSWCPCCKITGYVVVPLYILQEFKNFSNRF